MDRGYFKMWRMWFDDDSSIWPNESLVMIMVWCCKKATHKKRVVQFKTGKGEVGVSLEPGQLIFGRHKAAKQLGMNPETVRKRIKKLVDLGYITMQSTNQYSIISVNYYKELSIAGQGENTSKSTNQVPTKYQPSTTKKTLETLDNKEHSNSFLLQIPLIQRDGVFSIYQDDIDMWSDTFPGVDIVPTLKIIRQWNYDNPSRRKTIKGIRKHISSWLDGEQNKKKKGIGRPGFNT